VRAIPGAFPLFVVKALPFFGGGGTPSFPFAFFQRRLKHCRVPPSYCNLGVSWHSVGAGRFRPPGRPFLLEESSEYEFDFSAVRIGFVSFSSFCCGFFRFRRENPP